MTSSVYNPDAIFVSHSNTSNSVSEKNGRAVRRVFRKPIPAPPTQLPAWNVEESIIQLRRVDGSVNEVNGYTVRRGEVEKRFINLECAQRYISQNQ